MKKRFPSNIVMIAFCVALGTQVTRAQVPSPVVDPQGDALDVLSLGGPLIDIDTIDITFDATNLFFSISFHTPILPPQSGLPNSIFGILELDTDQNVATSIPGAPAQNTVSPPFPFVTMGTDFGISFDPGNTIGFARLFDSAGFDTDVPVTYGPNGVNGTVPLSALGGDDGLLHYTYVGGNGVGNLTDALDQVGVSVPEPASVVTLLTGCGLVLARRPRRGR
ncbi:MAG: PEP-CTERM sorting domain-containing protein [Phycisphaerales bacterium]|nr:PEP-CTERM sorting domain-containing protein [Phycisphaerales bacterium]